MAMADADQVATAQAGRPGLFYHRDSVGSVGDVTALDLKATRVRLVGRACKSAASGITELKANSSFTR